MLRSKIFLLLFFVHGICSAQDKSNRGKEFWLAYGFDYSFFHEAPVNNQELALYISTVQAATVTVSVTNTGYSQTLAIPANTVDATILIPKSGANDARTLTDGLQNRNIHIVSNTDVAVYAHVYSTMVSGATMLMPVETYGYVYHSINYYQTTSASSPADWYSWFYAIAAEDNTRLAITPSDSTKNGWLPGQTYFVTLNKGESFHVFGKAVFDGNAAHASKDMTGSKVVSVPGADGNCHPVALFSGSGGIRLCRGDGGEFMHQQVFPAQAWGTRYLTYHTINNTSTDILESNRNYYRVCVQDPTTVVRRNGLVLSGLINNFYYEFMDSTGGYYIEADKPIMVAQYMTNKNQCWNFPTTTPSPPSYGDPEMFYLSPIEQGQDSVLFYTSRRSSIDYVYANILLPTTAVTSLRVDNNPLPAAQVIPHPNYPAYSVALARFIGPAAQHRITCDSAFTATVYGLGNYESYGYNVGTLVNNLNHYSAIENVNNSGGNTDTFTCKNTPLRLFVKVGYPATSIHWKLSQVTGIFPNTDSVISNPVPVATEIINGRNYWVYSLSQDFTFASLGTFSLPVSYTASVIENCNQTEYASVKIVVEPAPGADFSWNNRVCLQDTIAFTGIPIPGVFNITGYEWLFDDASTASTMNTQKNFGTAGPHDVRFRVIADNGCIADTIKTVNILPAPVAKFGMQQSLCASDSLHLTDTSFISTGTITAWRWNFGDGTSLVRNTGSDFYHHFTGAGTYVVSLVVESNNGCRSDTLRDTVTVQETPLAKFGFDRNVCLGQSIQFSDSSSIAVGSIAQWQWNFGDGNTQVRNNALPFAYNYTAVGTYRVSLTAVAANGCSSTTFALDVNVGSKPSGSFTYNGKPCVDSLYSFTSAVAAGSVPTTWFWDYGDGSTASVSTGNTATHEYLAAATNLRVRHAVSYGGCPGDTTEQVIPLLAANPTAAFSLQSKATCVGKAITISGTASADASTWQWNFGNATGNTVPPFNYTYQAAGNYAISLSVQNVQGCPSAVQSQQVSVAPAPNLDAGPDIFMPPGESRVINASLDNSTAYAILWWPTTALNASNILNPVTSAIQNITYYIMAEDRVTGCAATDSLQVKVTSAIFIPNAFSPNADGINDTWGIPALQSYPDARVDVFNRYGERVYHSTGYARPWDGKYKGADQPQGAYIYIIQAKPGNTEVLRGTVMVVR